MVFRRLNDVEMHQCNQGKTAGAVSYMYIEGYTGMYGKYRGMPAGLFGHTISVCVQLG